VDPLTNAARPFSGNNGNEFQSNIRYDMAAKKLKVGAWIWRGDHRLDFRPTQRFEWSTVNSWGAWIETRAIGNLAIELGVENPNGFTVSRVRTDYRPDRRSGNVTQTQYRERSLDGTWYLSVKGKF
jgi:hypothetical protein